MVKVYYVKVSMNSKNHDLSMIVYDVPELEFNKIIDKIGGGVFIYRRDEVFEVCSNDLRAADAMNLLETYLVKS
jgi:hypothetical protein